MLDIVRQRGEWVSDFHLVIGFEGADKTDPGAPDQGVPGWSDQWQTPPDIPHTYQ